MPEPSDDANPPWPMGPHTSLTQEASWQASVLTCQLDTVLRRAVASNTPRLQDRAQPPSSASWLWALHSPVLGGSALKSRCSSPCCTTLVCSSRTWSMASKPEATSRGVKSKEADSSHIFSYEPKHSPVRRAGRDRGSEKQERGREGTRSSQLSP